MICEKCRSENTTCEECGGPARRSFLSRHKGLIIVLVLIFTFILFPLILLVGMLAAIFGSTEEEPIQTRVVSGSGDDRIALINIDGIIVENDPGGGFGNWADGLTSARKIKRVLEAVSKDPGVDGVLVRVNSPGGSAVAAEEIYRELLAYKSKTGKKITVYFSDLAASGGFFVAMAGDKVIASPSNITGSIGVIISYLTFGDLARQYGVGSVVYKSGAHKDIVSELREPTTEERQIMQAIVDDAYGNFVAVVSQGRSINEAEVRSLADGRVYSAKQARDLKLVDSLGSFEDAANIARQLANVREAQIVEYGQESFLDSLLGSLGGKLNVNLLPIPQSYFDSKPGPKLLYLYSP